MLGGQSLLLSLTSGPSVRRVLEPRAAGPPGQVVAMQGCAVAGGRPLPGLAGLWTVSDHLYSRQEASRGATQAGKRSSPRPCLLRPPFRRFLVILGWLGAAYTAEPDAA